MGGKQGPSLRLTQEHLLNSCCVPRTGFHGPLKLCSRPMMSYCNGRLLPTRAHTHTHTHTHMCSHTCTHALTQCTYKQTCAHMYILTYMDTCSHMDTCAHLHGHTHAHTHTLTGRIFSFKLFLSQISLHLLTSHASRRYHLT